MLGSPHSYIESKGVDFLPIVNLITLEVRIIKSGMLIIAIKITRK